MNIQDIADLIGPDTELRYRQQLCHEAYNHGHATGYHQGYEQAVRDLERNWQVVAQRIKQNAMAPTHAELKVRRAA